VTGADGGRVEPRLPPHPGRSTFALLGLLGALAMTLVSVVKVGLIEVTWAGSFPWFDPSFEGLVEFVRNWTNTNPVMAGLLDADFGQLSADRTRRAFIETFQLAVLGTLLGGSLALPLALWTTPYGNPFRPARAALRIVNSVIRSIPDLIWAGLFVAAVGIGALSGLLALVFFSLAVTTKLTSDTLDGVDPGPIEAANAAGAGVTEVLRTAVVPQILPAYSSYVLYNFELNLRASAVIGLVGAGGIGERINFFRNRGEWAEMWGIVLMFFIVVFVVEQISVSLRRRLV
jgi:phosphonate transport system permease protein